MFGFPSFIFNVVFAVFPFLFLVCVLWLITNRKHSEEEILWMVDKAPYLVLVTIVILLWTSVLGIRLYFKTTNYLFLRMLQPDSVVSIKIDETTLDEEQDISRIVTALNQAVWHETNHDIGGPYESMIITLRSGDVRTFRIGRYHGKDGALVEFFRKGGGGSTWEDGDAYIPELPAILEDSGYSLPPAGDW